ncbi:MAG: Ni/Fe-hydrogenase cytochrome b subunit [Proteobacteria bacterium]|nr:Ni/Fe-hydrogenase cytochrome b subunit [Pseudomonadota bacterium]
MNTNKKPLGGKILTAPVMVLAIPVLVALYFLAYRFIFGIGGPVSNLTDHQSWGVWKVLGVLVGAALVNGGYVTAFIVYIFNKGHYHRFVAPAVLVSFLGYSFAGIALLYDVGRYWGLLNFFIPKYWQPNSVLFEVAICVMSYVFILGIEFFPNILEKFIPDSESGKNFAAKLHSVLDRLLFLTVAFGVVLPTMHQSGLGGLAILFGQKLSPLWQTPFISLLYLISAIAMGLFTVTAVEILITEDLRDKAFVTLLSKLARLGKNVALVFILLRWVEILHMGGLGKAFELNVESFSFWLEMIAFGTAIYLLRNSKNRSSPRLLFLGACLTLFGGALYRVNTYIVGFNPAPDVFYFPSLPEFMISIGMFCLEIVIFITIVKIFPVLTRE